MVVGGQRHAPPALPPGKDSVPIVWEAGWVSQPVWTGTENLAPQVYSISGPTRPSESLYRLSYPGPKFKIKFLQNWKRTSEVFSAGTHTNTETQEHC